MGEYYYYIYLYLYFPFNYIINKIKNQVRSVNRERHFNLYYMQKENDKDKIKKMVGRDPSHVYTTIYTIFIISAIQESY